MVTKIPFTYKLLDFFSQRQDLNNSNLNQSNRQPQNFSNVGDDQETQSFKNHKMGYEDETTALYPNDPSLNYQNMSYGMYNQPQPQQQIPAYQHFNNSFDPYNNQFMPMDNYPLQQPQANPNGYLNMMNNPEDQYFLEPRPPSRLGTAGRNIIGNNDVQLGGGQLGGMDYIQEGNSNDNLYNLQNQQYLQAMQQQQQQPPPPPQMPDPQYQMMLKMIDPDLDLSEIIERSMGINKDDRQLQQQRENQFMGYQNGPQAPKQNDMGFTQRQMHGGGGGNDALEKLINDQSDALVSISDELKNLKKSQKKAGDKELKEHIKRLEKAISKKQKKAEKEELHYNLKRDMADYVKALGELFVTKTNTDSNHGGVMPMPDLSGLQTDDAQIDNMINDVENPNFMKRMGLDQNNMPGMMQGDQQPMFNYQQGQQQQGQTRPGSGMPPPPNVLQNQMGTSGNGGFNDPSNVIPMPMRFDPSAMGGGMMPNAMGGGMMPNAMGGGMMPNAMQVNAMNMLKQQGMLDPSGMMAPR